MPKSQIKMFWHCAQCMPEAAAARQSPADYQSIEVGWTERGFQVWCKRHDANVMHVDFEGEQHAADLSPEGAFEEETVQ